MSTSYTFQTELVAIMEVLTKAAVAEICQLVDDGYAVLRLEISRSRRENEDLKRQLGIQMDTMTAMPHSSANTVGDGGLQVPYGMQRSAKEGLLSKVAEGTLYETITERLGDGKSTALDAQNTPQHTESMSEDSCAARTGSRLIKVERLDGFEGEDPPGRLKISENRCTMESDDVESAPIVDTQSLPATGLEDLPKHNRTGQSIWENGRLDTVLKAEPDSDVVNLHGTGSEHTMGRLNSQGCEYVLYEGTGQLDTFFTQRTTETETEGPSCSYLTETSSDSLSVQSDLRLIPTAAKDVSKSSQGCLNGMNPASFEVAANVCFAWDKETLPGPGNAERLNKLGYGCTTFESDSQVASANSQGMTDTDHSSCFYSGSEDENSLVNTELEHAQNLPPSGSKSDAMHFSGSTVYEKGFVTSSRLKGQSKEKRLTCTYCGKRLSCTQTLEAHLRIHTGERPYTCSHCGKKFNQMSNLRTHQRTHTGQKPYCCMQCGKRFSDPGYLKRHQYVHTGERPFKCTECGKSFSFSNNLIRHRSVHTVKIN
ncbi:hypothetical protein JZ751_000717 [Albula glossodonta]|uniref:C2H2-type domain-containing protein n=1 Tax=Albula glossodonta TaxID=121402 RepID=A0A8T2PX46_9TELE|nr:hypothetical protein JZ751_000717 [Albula glossodonta]